MHRTSILRAPLLAFHSRQFYREAAGTWRGRSFLCLLIVLAVCWLPSSWKLGHAWATFVDTKGEALARQVPPITITGGVVSVEGEQPLYITDPDTARVLAVIDTTGEVNPLGRTGAVLHLGRDRLTLVKSPTETRVYSLAGFTDFRLDAATARLWLRRSRYAAAPLTYVFMVVLAYIGRLLEAIILAAAGAVVTRRWRPPLQFEARLSVALLALVPVIVLLTVCEMAELKLPLAWMVFPAVACAYTVFGLHAARPAAPAGPPFEPPAPPAGGISPAPPAGPQDAGPPDEPPHQPMP